MVEYSYSTNWMGPINYDWVKTHGEHWAGGRIDIFPDGGEIGLPVMHAEDWNRLTAWLNQYKTAEPVALDDILEAYYNDGYAEIRWWKK